MVSSLQITVSQLNAYVRSRMDEDELLQNVFVIGEISNFTNHYKSGHLYLTLKDEKASVKAVMFSAYARRLRFRPEDGMRVICRGRVSVYETSGQYQLYIEDMQPDGIGALNLAYEQLKNKLEKEGLFSSERKRSLPPFPERIGVITSDTGAAVHDIETILERRFPLAEVVLYPVLVQGEGAASQIVQALSEMNRQNAADVIIVGRGGGSLEDLWAFNEEIVARAVANSRIPVISAVGHETDVTICDFAADVRAATPSAAAELAVPDQKELKETLLGMSVWFSRRAQFLLENARQRLDDLISHSPLEVPNMLIEIPENRLENMQEELLSAVKNIFSERKHMLSLSAEKLQALSPLRVLARGYSVTEKEGGFVSSALQVNEGDKLCTKLQDGYIISVAENVCIDKARKGRAN